MSELKRYSLITEKMPREFVLLQGTGCVWKKCTFCDYYLDRSVDPFIINRPIIEKIIGATGTVDIINSGSAMELDEKTLELLKNRIRDLPVHTLWFEAHWLYRNQLNEFAKNFPNIKVKFRTGVETFHSKIRTSWNKGIPAGVCVEEIAKFFSGVCLLVGVKGQTKESIIKDIELAHRYFEYFSVNVFVENSTNVQRDEDLIYWFVRDCYPQINDIPKAEILLSNTDLGVG